MDLERKRESRMHYRIVEDSDSIRTEDIARLLKMTYWADKRSPETIEKAVSHSSCYGVYAGDPENMAMDHVIDTSGLPVSRVAELIMEPENAACHTGSPEAEESL